MLGRLSDHTKAIRSSLLLDQWISFLQMCRLDGSAQLGPPVEAVNAGIMNIIESKESEAPEVNVSFASFVPLAGQPF